MYSFLCCEFALSHRVPVPPLVLKAARPLRYLVRFFSILFSPRACIFFDVKVTDSRVLNEKKGKNSSPLTLKEVHARLKARGAYNLNKEQTVVAKRKR